MRRAKCNVKVQLPATTSPAVSLALFYCCLMIHLKCLLHIRADFARFRALKVELDVSLRSIDRYVVCANMDVPTAVLPLCPTSHYYKILLALFASSTQYAVEPCWYEISIAVHEFRSETYEMRLDLQPLYHRPLPQTCSRFYYITRVSADSRQRFLE